MSVILISGFNLCWSNLESISKWVIVLWLKTFQTIRNYVRNQKTIIDTSYYLIIIQVRSNFNRWSQIEHLEKFTNSHSRYKNDVIFIPNTYFQEFICYKEELTSNFLLWLIFSTLLATSQDKCLGVVNKHAFSYANHRYIHSLQYCYLSLVAARTAKETFKPFIQLHYTLLVCKV